MKSTSRTTCTAYDLSSVAPHIGRNAATKDLRVPVRSDGGIEVAAR